MTLYRFRKEALELRDIAEKFLNEAGISMDKYVQARRECVGNYPGLDASEQEVQFAQTVVLLGEKNLLTEKNLEHIGKIEARFQGAFRSDLNKGADRRFSVGGELPDPLPTCSGQTPSP